MKLGESNKKYARCLFDRVRSSMFKELSIISFLISNTQKYYFKDMKFVQATRDNLSNDESMLTFKKDDIIRLTDSKSPPGFLSGALRSHQGLIPSDYVRSISRADYASRSGEEKVYQPYLGEMYPKMNNTITSSSTSKSANYQDGHFSMMEFAMVHFKQSIEKLVIIDRCKSTKPNSESNGVLEKLKNLRLHNGNERGNNSAYYNFLNGS